MTRTLLGLALSLSIVAVSTAAPCSTVQCATGTAIVATPVAPVILPATQLVVPVYGSQFVPGAAQQQAQDEVLREILQELRAMRSELQALKQPAALPLSLANASQVMAKSCVKCHGAASADKDGGGFVMFNDGGGLLTLSDRDKQRIVNRVSRNSMPPAPAKLAAVDKKMIVDAFQGK